ncbi:hypothetical protein V5E97_17280 [Singulisphaera sp. Ch08]|uniref:Uncharacterized protein n=1 Tax=Singulisphaera sp. Ch08 TaxID=3120278 RepID=A0AAU7CQ82_9BACT
MNHWLDQELDSEGTPRRLPVGEWSLCLTLLAETRDVLGETWSPELDARIEGFFLATLRFMRTDGSMVFGPVGIAESTKRSLRSWADNLSEPGFQTVIDWWFPGPNERHSPPPLPASARPDYPLATLRADWSKSGDLMAIDHRSRGLETSFEFIGLGRTWLGPNWAFGSGTGPEAAVGRAKPSLWTSNYSVDLAEWSFRVGKLRVDRTALLFRGRRLALLADQIDGKPGSGVIRYGIPEGIDVIPAAENRSLAVTAGARVASPRLIPLSLPYRSTGEERGVFRREGNELVLRQPIAGRRGWLPLLISWDSGRNRKTLVWRPLTVSEGPKICEAETAVAYRVAWGRDESLVIYRSLARPVPRSFLGHKTMARFLIGLFTKEGNVEPILTVKE